MRVPVSLIDFFKNDYEQIVSDFLLQRQWIDSKESLHSDRFINRSLAPHVKTLSQLFNRVEGEQTDGIDLETYWKDGANPKNRKMAYFLSFHPCNTFRMASVWAELHRLGFRLKTKNSTSFRGIEFGAGTAAGALGAMIAERFAPLGLPQNGNMALIEQNKAALELGRDFLQFSTQVESREFHRRIELNRPFLPKSAPQFDFFLMSFFLNEAPLSATELALNLCETAETHLEEEGLILIVEPALKLQSRKLLELRQAILQRIERKQSSLQLLLPCLGHQACGALAAEDDWCHEEVGWWRPKFLQHLDQHTGLDRKTLPFSYLAFVKSKRPMNELLPKLSGETQNRYRLVSPARMISKKDTEFFLCGQDGKKRARWVIPEETGELERGDVLENVDLRGVPSLTRIDQASLLK